jgi:hypothetical protein
MKKTLGQEKNRREYAGQTDDKPHSCIEQVEAGK